MWGIFFESTVWGIFIGVDAGGERRCGRELRCVRKRRLIFLRLWDLDRTADKATDFPLKSVGLRLAAPYEFSS